MLQYEYARSALKIGLQLKKARRQPPTYKFGIIGSTDSHTGLATAGEDNFFGKHTGVEPGPNRYKHLVGETPGGKIYSWQMASSGYAAVWAKENTRVASFDAMISNETYATTGPQMIVLYFRG